MSFGDSIFYLGSIRKIQIPPKLKKLNSNCFYACEGLVDIEVSPENENFAYINNKYFVGKSKDDSNEFDILYYVWFDITEAFIPPQIQILNNYSFHNHKNLESVIYPENAKLTRIEDSRFHLSFDQEKRPTFDDIIEEMYQHSFKLSDEIDSELVMRRYRSLNRFRSKE